MNVETTRTARGWVLVLLVLATTAVYGRVVGFGFVNYDDPTYVFRNVRMAGGLSWGNIGWAFTTFHFNNWHPLTWLTYFATSQIFGMKPGAFHAVNLLLHVGNTALLYWLLVRMTGRRGCSAMVAGLFALHPLHVESVAWISELKDVLSTFFALLTLHAYVSYAQRRNVTAYVAMCVGFGLGLMAKPMIVTLPAVMLLLDYWPMGRLGWKGVVEKLPLFVMAGGACAATLAAQGTAIANHIALGARVANAVAAYGRYIARTLVPIHLAVYYPHPAIIGGQEGSLVLLSAVVLIGWSAIAGRQKKGRPYLLVGWLWFLGTLVPVSGLVQVGEQAMADRYTYFPLIGLFIAAVWLAADGIPSRRGKAVLGSLVLAGCALGTEIQLGYWRNTETLFTHALQATRENYVALDHLAVDRIEMGKPAEAIPLAQESIRIDPGSVYGHKILAQAYDVLGHPGDAVGAYHDAIAIDPADAELRNNAAGALAAIGRADEAERQYNAAIQLNPQSAIAHCNLGFLLASQGRLDEAINHWQSALNIDPSYPPARMALEQIRHKRSADAVRK
jgi:protein O-mannosyl-transferase